jgi:hypothetical protein
MCIAVIKTNAVWRRNVPFSSTLTMGNLTRVNPRLRNGLIFKRTIALLSR